MEIRRKKVSVSQRTQELFYRNRYVFLAFLVPFVLMFLAYAAAEFFPFGKNQVAVIDMYHQYFPFINELHEKIQSGGSLLYTWNGGLGTNFITLLSYYMASPLYFLTIFVPDAYLMEAVTVIILLKIGFAGAFMAIYLRGIHGRCDCATVAFSTLYALCAYVMGYYWCLMWLDVVALLPLCVLGLNRLIDRGDFKLYTITIAAMMLTNYYIGGMVCIFIFFYYPVLYFSRTEKRGAKTCLRITGKAVLCSVTGIFISGITLIPTFLNLQNTYYIDSTMPEESSFYNTVLDVLTNSLPDIAPTVREGMPNIYCGLLCVLLLACFFLCKSVPLRKRLLHGGMLAFLVLSLNWNKLDFMWHGFHFPNQLPYRYSFVISFLLVVLAYEAFLRIRQISQRQLAAIGVGCGAYVILAQQLYEADLRADFVYVGILLLILYMAFLAVYRMDRFNKTLMCFLLLVVVGGEMLNSAAIAVETVSSTNRDDYFAESSDMKKMVKDIQENDPGFYRIETAESTILNMPMLYNYPGVSEFSSTVNGNVSYLMAQMGLEAKDEKNRYNYVMTTPIMNAMLNVRYILSKGKPLEGEDALTLAGGEQTSSLYQNKYDLSIGYMVDQAAINEWAEDQDDPFIVQNDFVMCAAGTDEEILTSLEEPEAMGSNAILGEWVDGYLTCEAADTDNAATVDLTYTAPKEQQVYVYAETADAESITATTESGRSITMQEDCGAVVSVGKLAAGETVTITIQYETGKASEIETYAYGLEQDVWDKAYQKLDDELLEVTDYSDTKIEGTIQAQEDGFLLTSIPYEKGWSVEVDGEKREPQTLCDTFLAVPLKAGTHEVRFTYMPDGLIPGILVTLCGIGILVAMSFLRRRHPLKWTGGRMSNAGLELSEVDTAASMSAEKLDDSEAAICSETELKSDWSTKAETGQQDRRNARATAGRQGNQCVKLKNRQDLQGQHVSGLRRRRFL